MKTFLKLLNALRNLWSQIMLTIGVFCLAFLFMNLEKLDVSLNNFGLIDLLQTKTAILSLAFFFISLSMYVLNYTGYKTFGREYVNNYIIWFLTAISTTLVYSTYTTIAKIYSALHFEEPRDLIYNNAFFSINRLWSYEEFEVNALRLAEQMGVNLSKEELSELCLETTNLTQLADQTRAFCSKKLESLDVVVEQSGWGSYIFELFNATSTFVLNNKVLSFTLALMVGLGAYSLFRNYSLKTPSDAVSETTVNWSHYQSQYWSYYQPSPQALEILINKAINISNENTERAVTHVEGLTASVEDCKASVEDCKAALRVVFDVLLDNDLWYKSPSRSINLAYWANLASTSASTPWYKIQTSDLVQPLDS